MSDHQSAIEQVRAYLQHKPGCRAETCGCCGYRRRCGCAQPDAPVCTCGLDELLAALSTPAAEPWQFTREDFEERASELFGRANNWREDGAPYIAEVFEEDAAMLRDAAKHAPAAEPPQEKE